MDDLEGIFEAVQNEFLGTLSAAERDQFHPVDSVGGLLGELSALEAVQKLGRRGPRLLQPVKKFGDNIEPFFKVIEILCAAHPEWANIALGALRLILQLASNFVTFFEKLCQAIQKLNAKLPRYNEMANSLAKSSKVSSPRLVSSFKATIKLLFEFFIAVARVFSKNGKIKRTPIIVVELMWKPFDARFEGILESLDFHATILSEEINFLLLGMIQDEQISQDLVAVESLTLQKQLRELFNRCSKDAFLASALKWLDHPPEFKETLEQAQAARTERTAEWVFDNPIFMAWRQSEIPFRQSATLLWINGNPGSGKTVLAGSIIEELDRQPEDGAAENLVFYYFFNKTSGSRNSSADAYRSIATQILQQFCYDQMIQDIFALAMPHYPIQTKATENELLDLMRQVFHHFQNTTIVLDGLDECEDGEKLYKEISGWCRDADVKVLLLSRPNVLRLRQQLGKEAQIALSRDDLDIDIAVYLRPQIVGMEDEGLFPPNSREDDIVTRLVSRAEGMFLWARLMVAFLRSPALTKSERMETIMETTPDGLDAIYRRIHSQILSLNRPSRELACHALTWVAYSPRKLCCSAIKQASKPGKWDGFEDGTIDQFHDALIFSSCGILERPRNVYQYIHLSAREYFVSWNTGSENSLTPLLLEERLARAQILTRCISLLAFEIPLRPLPSIRGRDGLDDIETAFPLLQLASLEWIPFFLAHANSVRLENDDLYMSELVSKFLNLHLNVMIWIESLYAFSPTYIGESTFHMLKQTRTLLPQNDRPPFVRTCLQDLEELLIDLQNLDQAWNETLADRPSALWGDVTLFTKSRFLVPTRAGSLQTFPPSMEIEGKRKTPMFYISRSSEDGSLLATLAIYPHQYYLAHFEARRWGDTGIKEARQGWIANFETRTLSEGQSLVSSSFTTQLDASDVELFLLQQGQSFPKIDRAHHLPISIKPDLSCFTVFNKLFLISSIGKAQLSTLPLGLPLQADARLAQFWSPSTSHDYEYEISWTDDGRYLVFVDGSRETSSSWIGVFRAEHQELQEPLELINSTLHQTFVKTKKAEVASHPERPVLAFRISRSIFLWPFLEGSPYTFQQWARQPATNFPQGSVDMSFSQCGRYLVLSGKLIGRPEALQLPQEPEATSHRSKQIRDTDVEKLQKIAKISDLVSKGDESSEVTRGKLPEFISDSTVALSVTSSDITATAIRTSRSPYTQVELVRSHSSGKENEIPLLQLPSQIPANSFSTTLQSAVSDDQQDQLKIILNKTSTKGNGDIKSAGSEHLPLVVWKDPRSLCIRGSDSEGTRDLLAFS